LKKFFVLWISQAVSQFGSSIVDFALIWYLTRETGSATILATSTISRLVPNVVLGPLIGPLIDRWSRKKIMIYADFAAALLTVFLIVLFITHTLQIWHIYLVIIGRSIAGSFQNPAFSASIRMLVPEDQLTRVNGFNQTLRGLIVIASPATGAFLMELLPLEGVVAVDVITAVIAFGCILPLTIPKTPHTTLSVKPNVIGDMMQGFRYLVSWRGLLFLFIWIGFLNFFGAPTHNLVPLFVKQYFSGDVLKLGWLQTAAGVGIIIGGLIVGTWGGFKRRIVTCFSGVILQSIVRVAFGFVTEQFYWSGVAIWFITGIGGAIAWAPIHTIIQMAVPKDMQGRIYSALEAMMGTMMVLSLAITGPVVDIIGVRMIYIIGGTGIFLLTIVGFFSRDLMNIEKLKQSDRPFLNTPAKS
jgi:MFS transporter, DHA3 family, macrolide efflux protein